MYVKGIVWDIFEVWLSELLLHSVLATVDGGRHALRLWTGAAKHILDT